MKPFVFFVAVLFITACNKTSIVIPPPVEPHPQMRHTDLQDAEVSFGNEKVVDVDGDSVTDFFFGVILVGDPVLERDRLQYYAMSAAKRNLLNDANDQSPVLNKMDTISKTHAGYTWWEVSAVLLAEKITTMAGSHWEGLWKNAQHKYLPIQVNNNGSLLHGWVEVSFNVATEKLTLHNAALSKEEGKTVKAGVK